MNCELDELYYPEENFGLEMQMNLKGFYFRLARSTIWSPAIRCLAAMIHNEYKMRQGLHWRSDYDLEEGEDFHMTPGSEEENWSLIFYFLGRRLKQKRPLTLWCDLFALSIMYSQMIDVHVMFQPCFF